MHSSCTFHCVARQRWGRCKSSPDDLPRGATVRRYRVWKRLHCRCTFLPDVPRRPGLADARPSGGRDGPGEGGAAMTDLAAAPRIDGRTARATRTRNAIVDAHLALISEGDLKPTGERIAERAGVSLRALWANFKDMEALFAASGERVFSRQAAEHAPVSADLPLSRRIEEFCQQRVRDARDHRADRPGRRDQGAVLGRPAAQPGPPHRRRAGRAGGAVRGRAGQRRARAGAAASTA